ncbi:MAG: PQQ-binding-like beta-propeller repeat protein, partial [Planctomycetes bacterium]|nr:PQQ-binding-like beta-propeller repeat protein [Planctomycetota bacterium]
MKREQDVTTRPRLSLCMIARDNVGVIEPCLESIRPWVDEIVVVDTGSKDDTPRKAEQFGARLSHFPWIDDFSAARNESLRRARGEWLFWMDSDDTISADCGRKLRDLVQREHHPATLSYVMQVHCPGGGPNKNAALRILSGRLCVLLPEGDPMRFGIGVLCLASCVLSMAAAPAAGQEWTRFRGPNGSGISDAKTVPVSFEASDANWKIELPGIGHSSPVVWGQRLFITSADLDAGKRYLMCVNTADGSIHWTREYPFDKYKKHKNNSFASNTPVVDAERVVVLWQSREASTLIALDHSGKQVWQYDLGPYTHGQGGATSPIVYEDMVIVCNDHKQGSFLLAVDCKSGEVRWKIGREGKRACYSTPCVYKTKDRPAEIIFTHSFEGIVGVDPRTGKQNWMIDVFGTFPQRAVGSPVLAGDLILGGSGAAGGDKNVVAVRPIDSADGVKEVYRVTRGAPHVPTPLVVGARVFLWADNGIVTCIKSNTGEKVWRQRVGGNFFGSPICIDGKIYCVDLEGEVVVLAASDEYELLARNPLGKLGDGLTVEQ